MFRIDHATAAPVLPTPDPVGTQGYFTKGDPQNAIPATRVTQDWANAVQEELANAIEAQGLTLDKGSRGQLTQAILRAAGRGSNGNLLLNPDFRLWQRSGPSPSAGTVGSTLGIHGPDRWLLQAGAAGDVASILRSAFLSTAEFPPSRAPTALQFNRTAIAGAGEALLRQRVESVHSLAAGPAVVAFDARKVGASADVTLVAVELVQRFGSGGSADVTTTLAASGGFLIDSSIRRLVFTGELPTTIGKTEGSNSNLELRIRFPASQLFNVLLSGFVLARGPEDPGYFVRPLPQEVQLCQRFFEKTGELDAPSSSGSPTDEDWDEAVGDTGFGTGTGTLARKFAVQKYADPTVVWWAVDDPSPGANEITEFNGAGLAATHAVVAGPSSKSHTGTPFISAPPASGSLRRFAARWTAEAEIP